MAGAGKGIAPEGPSDVEIFAEDGVPAERPGGLHKWWRSSRRFALVGGESET